jgi:metal-responsive CopG/Arc/MetJ family transcriptional regulator
MKTAISIPDAQFAEAEKVAADLGISRSELYQRALAAFLTDYQQEDITEKLNAIYAEQDSHLDPDMMRLQVLSIIDGEEW